MELEEENIDLPAYLRDSDNEEVDEKKHAKLMDAISSIDGKGRNKQNQRTVTSAEVSEFGLNQVQGKVKLGELLGTLKQTDSRQNLKKNLRNIQKTDKTVPIPLPKHEREKIERSVSYKKTSDELKVWDPVVEKNKNAEQIVFPLVQPDLRLYTAENVKQHFKPRTPLELEVAKLLHGGQNVVMETKPLTKSEERAQKAMSLEEARERRAELLKHKALLSYKEAKARWQKKIKSKKYHRILRKEKQKREAKALEELQKKDPDAFEETLALANKHRIQERMSLKHRGGSKYAKKQMIYAKYDQKARQEVQDMVQKSKQLTEKPQADSDSDEDDSDDAGNDDEEEEDGQGRQVKNPWISAKPAHGGHSSSEQFTTLTELRNTEVGEENISEEREDIAGSDEVEEEEEDAMEVLFKSNSKSVTKPFKETKRCKKKLSKAKQSVKNKKKDKGVIPDCEEEEEEEIHEALIAESLDRKSTFEELETLGKQPRTEDVTSASPRPNIQKSTRKDKKEAGEVRAEKVDIDPRKMFTVGSNLSGLVTACLTEEEEEEVGDMGEEGEDQRMTIAQAFADDDVIDEFVKEKQEVIDEEKPQDVNLVLPGWGEWGGAGLRVSKKKKKRFTVKALPGPPRKDAGLGHVIMHEGSNKVLKQHQVDKLPFPYITPGQFEGSLRAPVGRDWNTELSFRKLVQPRVVTKRGAVIEPIDKSVVFDKEKKNNLGKDIAIATKKRKKIN